MKIVKIDGVNKIDKVNWIDKLDRVNRFNIYKNTFDTVRYNGCRIGY